MYFITIKRMLEVCFSAHPNIQYRAQKKHPQKDAFCSLTNREIDVREKIRTPDTLVRSQVLYPAELHTHTFYS